MENEVDLLTVKEAAAIMRMSDKRVYQLIQEGKVPALKMPGGAVRISKKSLIDSMTPANPKQGETEVM